MSYPYDEQQVVAFEQDVVATYRRAFRVPDLENVVWAARMVYDATTMGYPASRSKHLTELEAALGLTPAPGPDPLPLPAPPTRDQVGAVRIGFQGMTITTREYGTFPAFGPETTTLADDDLRSYCQQMRAAGWTHGEIAVSWQYAEPGFLMPVPGRDLTSDAGLVELTRRIAIMLETFTAVAVFCAGDGLSLPQNPDGSWPYNDPVGHTYGHEWLMANYPRIRDALVHSRYGNLLRYCLIVPGYDGVFYGWGKPGEVPDRQPDRVVAFGNLVRSLDPEAYLAIEHTPGKIPVGEGGSDWAAGGRMTVYDVILSEFDWPATGDQVWQVVGRLNRPYHRPPDQPAGDDPNPPYYLATPSPRGPYFYVPYEYATYQWTRGQVTAAQIQERRDYFYSLGCLNVC